MTELQPYQTNRHHNTIPMLIAILALVFATGVVGIVYGVLRYVDNNAPTSTLTVNGMSERKARYTKASTTFYITEKGTNIEQLNTIVDQKITKVSDYLKSQQINDKDIKVNKTSYPDYSLEYSPVPVAPATTTAMPAPTGTMRTIVEGSVHVVFAGLSENDSKPNRILSELTKLGVSRFDAFQYEVENKAEICEDLKNEAIQDAAKKSNDSLKELGGRKVVRYTINEQSSGCNMDQYYPVPYPMANSADMAMGSGGTSVPNLSMGEETLRSTVSLSVQFR